MRFSSHRHSSEAPERCLEDLPRCGAFPIQGRTQFYPGDEPGWIIPFPAALAAKAHIQVWPISRTTPGPVLEM